MTATTRSSKAFRIGIGRVPLMPLATWDWWMAVDFSFTRFLRQEITNNKNKNWKACDTYFKSVQNLRHCSVLLLAPPNAFKVSDMDFHFLSSTCWPLSHVNLNELFLQQRNEIIVKKLTGGEQHLGSPPDMSTNTPSALLKEAHLQLVSLAVEQTLYLYLKMRLC